MRISEIELIIAGRRVGTHARDRASPVGDPRDTADLRPGRRFRFEVGDRPGAAVPIPPSR